MDDPILLINPGIMKIQKNKRYVTKRLGGEGGGGGQNMTYMNSW